MNINNNTLKKENQFKLDTHPAMNRGRAVYNHEEFGQIKVLMKGDDIWVLAKDIANILGYSDTNAMTRYLDADESMSVKLTGMNMSHTVISEAGLYSAIIRSRVEGAKKFKRWVTHEILPSIRKHGFYGTDNFIDNILANQSVIVASLKKYKDDRQRRRLAEQQRDNAIKVINSKDNHITYLQYVLLNSTYLKNRKIEYLKWQLDDPHTWAPVRDISWLKDYFNMDQGGCTSVIGRKLSYLSRRLGLNPRQIAYPKWGIVNIYHADVIQRFHCTLIKDQNFMKRYRLRQLLSEPRLPHGIYKFLKWKRG